MPDQPTSITRDKQENVIPGLAEALAVAAHTAATFGADAVVKRLQVEDDLFVQIDASWADPAAAGVYFVALTFRNPTRHGAYLEKMNPPQGTTLDLLSFQNTRGGSMWLFGPAGSRERVSLPRLLRPGATCELIVEITDSTAQLAPFPWAQLEYVYTLLDKPQDDTRSAKVKVTIRKQGPSFVP
jgi:hypothetical protein